MRRNDIMAYVNSVVGSPFVWGELDCTLFPAKCLDILQGTKNSQLHTTKWRGIKSAVRYAAKNNVTLDSWLAANGCIEIQRNYQQTGDFLMMDTVTIKGHQWLSAAVYLGLSSAVCTENGIEIVKTSDVDTHKIVGIR